MLSLRHFLVVLALGSLVPVSGAANGNVNETKRSYDIPAGDAATSLKRFSAISGRETLATAPAVRGVRTPAVRGQLTAQEALDALLAGTGLVASVDSQTGAIAIRRAVPIEGEPDARSAGATTATATTPRAKDGVITLDDYTVTGSRLRANSSEHPVQPVLTFSSLDIERTGAANLGQLFQYIPSVTSYTSGLGYENVNGTIVSGLGSGQTQSRTSAQLRGGSQTETLLLVDGKRVPLTALRNAGGNGYDLGGIPLSAVERVEVLLDGASAIYGADAVNGVINVILKKRYSGTEVRLNYDNTFDTDAGVVTASLTHGFAHGRWSGLLTLSASENNILLLTDRYLTRSYDRTLYGGITNQSQPTLYAEGTGSLNAVTGNLPGTTTPRVSIPVGYAGGAITVADYTTAPAPVGGVTPGRRGATSFSEDRGAYLRLGYEAGDGLTITGSARLSRREFRDNGDWRRVENVTIPAGYPGNPFPSAVRLSKTFYDLPPIVNGSETAQDEYSLSAVGKLPGNWRYDLAVTYLQGMSNMLPPFLDGALGQIGSQVAPSALFTARLNAEIAAGRRPLLIYDSNRQSPNAPGALDPFWVSQTQTKLNDRVRNWTYSAQADGRLFSVPAGDVTTVIGTEMREEYVAFPGSIGGTQWSVIPQRDVISFFAEARFPLVSRKQSVPVFHQFDLTAAARTEDYSDFGRATTPRYGAAWRPVRPLLIRASYGEGFLAPQLYRVAAAVGSTSAFTFQQLFPGAVDLARGNAPLTGPALVVSGGNPDLKPQQSESSSVGIVIDVPNVNQLSVSFDYYVNNYTNAFGSISDIVDRQRYAPQTILRGPRLPTDPAGWLGPMTGYDGRNINIAESRSVGYSYGVRYQRPTAWGDIGASILGEKTLAREERLFPNSVLTASVNKRFVPERITATVFWNRGPWDVGATGVYGGESWANSNNAALFPSRYTKDVTRIDLNAAHDFGRRSGFSEKGSAWWRRALHDTKVRATIVNVFNTEPPLNVNGALSSLIIDPRLRRYIIDITKRF